MTQDSPTFTCLFEKQMQLAHIPLIYTPNSSTLHRVWFFIHLQKATKFLLYFLSKNSLFFPSFPLVLPNLPPPSSLFPTTTPHKPTKDRLLWSLEKQSKHTLPTSSQALRKEALFHHFYSSKLSSNPCGSDSNPFILYVFQALELLSSP